MSSEKVKVGFDKLPFKKLVTKIREIQFLKVFPLLIFICLLVSCNNTKKATSKISGRFSTSFSGNADERDYAYIQKHPEVLGYLNYSTELTVKMIAGFAIKEDSSYCLSVLEYNYDGTSSLHRSKGKLKLKEKYKNTVLETFERNPFGGKDYRILPVKEGYHFILYPESYGYIDNINSEENIFDVAFKPDLYYEGKDSLDILMVLNFPIEFNYIKDSDHLMMNFENRDVFLDRVNK